jgi:hypothetical protein
VARNSLVRRCALTERSEKWCKRFTGHFRLRRWVAERPCFSSLHANFYSSLDMQIPKPIRKLHVTLYYSTTCFLACNILQKCINAKQNNLLNLKNSRNNVSTEIFEYYSSKTITHIQVQ